MRALFRIAAVLALMLSDPAWPGTYPVKPVHLIVAGPAGGGADLVARQIAVKLSESLGQQFVVDDRPGASGLIAGQATAAAAPDGYTFLLATISAICINPYLVRKPPYDPVRDLAPITLVATAGLMVTVNPELPVKTIGELIALAKSRPGQLNYASNGSGSLSHLSTELFAREAGITMTHVPYKGGPPAATDTVAGSTQVVITAVPTLIGHVRASRLRALAVTGRRRIPALPELPTVAESGVPGFEASQWFAAFAPKDTPAALVQRLYRELAKAADIAEVRAKLAQEGAELAVAGPDKLAELVRSDSSKWAKLIRELGVVLE